MSDCKHDGVVLDSNPPRCGLCGAFDPWSRPVGCNDEDAPITTERRLCPMCKTVEPKADRAHVMWGRDHFTCVRRDIAKSVIGHAGGPEPESLTVWIVEAWSAHDTTIEGIFISEDLAKEHMRKNDMPEGAAGWGVRPYLVHGSSR